MPLLLAVVRSRLPKDGLEGCAVSITLARCLGRCFAADFAGAQCRSYWQDLHVACVLGAMTRLWWARGEGGAMGGAGADTR